ncbi:MAG TPA: structural protein [Pseudomonas sp.]|uniref:structural protein n=1 Tax=Pseudomonas sp. TaxID=306 RepID=UPI002CAABA6D|nr:structural protein [Pseudomonas sp.]HWH86338.1 structural protein [Pseudomonas sp.]
MSKGLLPRGIRNHNPGNIVHSTNAWRGKSLNQTDPRFVVFDDPLWGIRAIARTLCTYQMYRLATDGSCIDSVREIISRWAPLTENDTHAYVHHVAACLEVDPDDPVVDVTDYHTLRRLVLAIIGHENGEGPMPCGGWYPGYVIDGGLYAAGAMRSASAAIPA